MQKKKNNPLSYLNNTYSLITGAGGLLGEQHASALLDIKSNIILTDINEKKIFLLKKKLKKKYKNSNILHFKLDVSNENSVKKLHKFLINKKYFVNVLINNAALDSKVKKGNKMDYSGKIEQTSLKNWNRFIDVNLTGAFLCSKFFGSQMAKKGGGIIINIASDLSLIAPNHSIYLKGSYKPVMYSVTKHGIIGLTKYLSTYWNTKNVRCNALSPGPVDSNQGTNFKNKLKKLIPLNRLAKKNEYKSAIQFLATDASSYMTGQNLIMDGGRSVW